MKNIHQFIIILSGFVILLLGSCGTVPVPFSPIAIESDTHKNDSNQQNNPKNPKVAQTSPIIKRNEKIEPVVIKPLTSPNSSNDIFTPKEHIQNAISYLQVGKAQNAYSELQMALKKEPDNDTALKLTKQITRTPDEFFKNDHYFSYTTEVGDSLSTIAKTFLNDPYMFYILSKYNDIDNPSRLQVGQTIRVPGSKPKYLSVKPLVRTPPTSESHLKVATNYYNSGKYQSAIDVLENVEPAEKKDSRLLDLLVLSYTKYSSELAAKADLLEARTLLEKALIIQPTNKKLKQQLVHIESKQEADRLYKVGLSAMQDGDDDGAYSAFKEVLKLEANHALAKKQISNLKSEVIETYYKEGMAMYRRHQLTDAIVRFDKILTIDNEHEMAKLYRARAFELQKKLEILEKDKD